MQVPHPRMWSSITVPVTICLEIFATNLLFLFDIYTLFYNTIGVKNMLVEKLSRWEMYMLRKKNSLQKNVSTNYKRIQIKKTPIKTPSLQLSSGGSCIVDNYFRKYVRDSGFYWLKL